MLKKWFLLLLACLMLFALAACHKEEPTPPSVNPPAPNKPTNPPQTNAAILMDSGALQNGAITWELYTTDGQTGTLYLKGSGALEDFESANEADWWLYGDRTTYGDRNVMEEHIVLITAIVVEEGITELGENAFAEQESVKTVTLPSTLTKIANSCFKDCINLQTVLGGTGVTSIEANAFKYCSLLETVELSSALLEVGEAAFDELKKSLTVRFHGTEAQWSDVEIDVGNGKLEDATIVYISE
jgi:hypothetical protein